MNPRTKERYDAVLKALVLRHGDLQGENSYYGSGTDPDYRHVNECQVRSNSTPEERYWQEFGDTFNGDITVHGVELTGVSCACGKLVDRTLRWSASVTDMLQAVLEEVMGE